MSKILWIGDAVVSSGFGRCTTKILEQVVKSNEVAVIGVNFYGDPIRPPVPYPVYPAHQPGSHPLGYSRLRYVLEVEAPDVIVVQTNPWNVPGYVKEIRKYSDAPIIGVIAVEGRNPGGHWITKLDHAIFWTEFGKKECEMTGWEGPSSVIPLGVDLDKFYPGDQAAAREMLALPDDVKHGFIVTNVNRNQHRKRLDLSIMAFAEWVRTRNINDAFLYLHAMQGSTVQLDVDGLVRYFGVGNRVIYAEPVDVFKGTSHDFLLATYQASNVGLSTSLGEGWGLTVMESMACGIANVATKYSAVPEWAGKCVKLIPCVSEGVMPDVYGQLGGIPSVDHIMGTLDLLYKDRAHREELGHRGLLKVQEPQFRWEAIGQRYAEVIDGVLQACGERRVPKEGASASDGNPVGDGSRALSRDGNRSDGVQTALSR